MRDYIIFTDSSADLSEEMSNELGIRVIQLDVILEGEAAKPNNAVDICEFYNKLREKKGATTAALGMDRFFAAFESAIQEGYDVLYLGFSSGLSSTYNASTIAARELCEKYRGKKVIAVDTLCASMGQGLLVYHACMMKKKGASIEEVRDFVEQNKLNLCHWFTVDDLFFLKRGGRVSAATAVVGTVLNIKPVLHVDNDGKLVNVSKARGRKAAMDAMFEKAKASILSERNDVIFISHGDCEKDAQYLANRVRNELGIKQVVINFIGPVIGAHSGPGTLAIFFLGSVR